MYKLICANITKSRLNFTDSYKKLAQTKKLNLNGGWSQPVLGKDLVEEELQECIEDDNGIGEKSKTTTVEQKRPSSCKLIGFKSSPWKFYTGNVVIREPPIPSISKKYYHLYSITSSLSKRPFSDSKLTSNERNYMEAIEDIATIETQKRRNEFQFKPMDTTRFPSASVHNTKVLKKGNKKDISYPTHTVKHNLTLAKRFRIRQGSADGKLQEMEAKLKKRKLQHRIPWKGLAPKSVTYPKLIEHVKKTRSNPLDNPPNEQEKNQLTVEQEGVKSHPTIEKASNEAKMRLKTKFIQLLLKSSKNSNSEPVNKESEQVNVTSEDPECVKMEEEESKNVKSHPTVPSDIEALKSSYARCRYPKRVWMDNLNISGLNLEEVCIKDSVTKTGSGLITRNYGKETPKPNYEKVEQEAKQLSGFVEKARRNKKPKPKPIPKSSKSTLSGLKEEKLELIKELDKLDVKFTDFQEGKLEGNSTSEKVRKILTGEMGHEVPPKPVDSEFEDDLKCEKSAVKSSTSPKLKSPKASLYHTDKKVRKTDGILDLRRESSVPETLGGRNNIDGKARSNKLEEPTKVEELNEQANEKTKIYKKNRKLQKARRDFEELQSQVESLPSMKINNITPRFDKTQDRIEEKVEIAEKTKEVIEDIKREASAAVPRKKAVVKNKNIPMKISSKPKIQPVEPPKVSETPDKVQEIDATMKDIQKEKKNLDEFGEKKKEWSEMLAQVFVGSRGKENAKEIQNKATPSEESEVHKADTKTPATNTKNSEIKVENKSDGSGFSCSANQSDCFKKAKIVFHDITTVIPIAQESPVQLNPGQNDVTVRVEELVTTMPQVKESLANLKSEKTVEWLSVTKIVNSTKATEKNAIPKEVYDKDIQAKESNKEAKKMSLQYRGEEGKTNNLQSLSSKEALKLFREQVLDKYFDTIVFPTVDQTVYTPKERRIVNDIKEVEKKDYYKELEESDSAVIRPGDEIVFVRQDLEKTEEPPNNVLEDIKQNSNVANQLAVMESSILTETKKQIDEIMKKINDLEMMFKEQQTSLGEKISGNKVRVPPPPKPPTAKDQKDIKKEKPKGPNDIVLPPKVHGPLPDKSPSQDLLQSNTKPATEYKSYVLQDGDQIAISDEQHKEKVRKYFVKKFGLTSGSQIDAKSESVAKTSKVHQSTCSATKFCENSVVDHGKLTYWTENRPISCPPIQRKPRSSSTDTLGQKSRGNDLSKNYLKANYSTLSGPKRLSQISVLPTMMKNIPLVVETNMNKLTWKTTNRSASADSRGESKDRAKSKSKNSSEQKLEDKPETTKSDINQVSWSKILKSNNSTVVNKKKPLTKNNSEVIELASTLQSKQFCAADANLQQNDPIAVLNVRLAPNEVGKKLLSGKRSSSLTDLEKNSVAGISTTSTLNDKKPKSANQEGEQKNKSRKKKEKTAIFRLQPDGEVMIIKKAEDMEKLPEKKMKPKQENKKYIVYLTESQENISEKKNKSCQSTSVLMAKVEEILVKKPINKTTTESLPTNAICDDFNEFFKTETPRITAKIETIYDKQYSVKIRKNNRLKQFNPSKEIRKKPIAWKSLFEDDFFQQLPNETFIQPQKVGRPKSDTLPLGKLENEQPPESLERLNMKYALMLRNIEKRLAERRRRLEINKEQIEQINKILNLEPEYEEPPLTHRLPQKEEVKSKPPTFNNLLRKVNKISVKKETSSNQALTKMPTKNNVKSNQSPVNLENLKTEGKSVAAEEFKIFAKKSLIEETILDNPKKIEELTKPVKQVKPKIYKTGNVNYLNKPKEKNNLYKLDVPDTHTPKLENVEIEESKLYAKKMLLYDTILGVEKSFTQLQNNNTTVNQLQESEVVAAPKTPLIDEIVMQKNHTKLLNSFTSDPVEIPQSDILDSVMKEMSSLSHSNLYKLEVPAIQPKLNTLNYVLKVGKPSKAEWKSVKVDETQVFGKRSLLGDTVLADKSLKNKSLKPSQTVEAVAPKITSVSEILVQKKQSKLLDDSKVKTVKIPEIKKVAETDTKLPKLPLPIETMEQSKQLNKKYELEKDEPFMSVEKTKIKSLQAKKTDSLVDINELKNPSSSKHIKRPTTVITQTELEQQARKEKLQRSTRKSRAEQNALRQKIKSKKNIVQEINSTAEELRRKQYRKPYETLKGTRRQEMYRHDAKVIQPSVGSCLWGNKLKSLAPSGENNKEFHCSATKNNSDFNRLMSKAEFLELKRKAKNRTNLKELEMIYNIKEIQKNLTHDFNEDQNLEQPKSETSPVPKKTFSEEIFRYLSAKLQNTANMNQTAAEKVHSEITVSKPLIGDEIYNYLSTQQQAPKKVEKPPSDVQLTQRIETELKTINQPIRQLSDDELRFKVTQMAILAAKNVVLDTQDEKVNIQSKKPDSGRTKLEDTTKNTTRSKFELASIDETSLNPKMAAEKMADLKRRNKLARRSQSQDLQNISTLNPTKSQNPETPGPVSTCFQTFKEKSKNICGSKLVLAMRTPQCALKDCCDSLDTTLHVTAKSTRLVSLETLKMLKIENKESPECGRKVTDRLARYRHLKISYMTVARPRGNKKEKFLPEVVENFEGNEVTEKEKQKILTYRFELLKQLNNEFQQQLNQQLTTKPTSCDSESDMNPRKPAFKSDFYDALLSILKVKCTKNQPAPKNGKKGGSTRRYCTDSTKCPGDDQEEQVKVNVCNTVVENTKVETGDAKQEQPTPPPKCNFDITEALPKAFEKASPQLVESEQSNLYYRYHQMSFADLHESLADKRTSAVEAAEKKKQEECEKQVKTVSSPKT